MKANDNSGQVTVFLIIILLSVFLLAGVLVDGARIQSARSIVKNAADISAQSALANYNSKLKNNYGIFAIEDSDEIQTEIKKYISKNLSIDEEHKNSIDLYHFKIESVKVTQMFNIKDKGTLKSQILEYIKYRAPYDLAENFISKITAIKETGKISEAYNLKVEVDKTFGAMDLLQQNLKKIIDGGDVFAENFINGFNFGGYFKQSIAKYESFNNEFNSIKDSIVQIENSISAVQSKIENSKAMTKSEKIKVQDEMEKLISQKNSYETQAANILSTLNKIWGEMRNNMTGDFILPNSDAISEIKKILQSGKQAVEKINLLKTFLDGNFTEEGIISGDFLKSAFQDITKMQNLIFDSKEAENMISRLNSNNETLKNIIAMLDQAIPGSSTFGDVSSQLNELIDSYNQIDYVYQKTVKNDSVDDPRKDKAEEANTIINENTGSDINYETSGIKKADLPSGETDERREMIDERGEIDLYNTDSDFPENTFGLLGQWGKTLAGSLKSMRDNIYINEYIMGIFKNSVPISEEEGLKTKSRDTFYDSETEYILHGNASQNTNKMLTKAQILMMRFALDTLQIYSDIKKKEAAISIATAVSGWWTGGLGIPVVSNLIMCGWGMGEAIIDIKDIYAGKAVPIFKTKKETGVDFNYHDYLRLFLLAMDEGKKLGRVQDLIQLNMQKADSGFKLADCNMCIKVDVSVSIKYMFGARRKTIHVATYQGY